MVLRELEFGEGQVVAKRSPETFDVLTIERSPVRRSVAIHGGQANQIILPMIGNLPILNPTIHPANHEIVCELSNSRLL